MNFLDFYLIFIIATASTSTVFLFVPLLKQATENQVDSIITRQPVLSTIAYYLVALVFAPFLFFILLNQTATEKYKTNLTRVIDESQKN